MVGIAWGSPRLKGAGFADVPVAESVQDYEHARIGVAASFEALQ